MIFGILYRSYYQGLRSHVIFVNLEVLASGKVKHDAADVRKGRESGLSPVSTKQHSTARHSTEQNRTAQHGTVLRPVNPDLAFVSTADISLLGRRGVRRMAIAVSAT